MSDEDAAMLSEEDEEGSDSGDADKESESGAAMDVDGQEWVPFIYACESVQLI